MYIRAFSLLHWDFETPKNEYLKNCVCGHLQTFYDRGLLTCVPCVSHGRDPGKMRNSKSRLSTLASPTKTWLCRVEGWRKRLLGFQGRRTMWRSTGGRQRRIITAGDVDLFGAVSRLPGSKVTSRNSPLSFLVKRREGDIANSCPAFRQGGGMQGTFLLAFLFLLSSLELKIILTPKWQLFEWPICLTSLSTD